MQLNKLYEIQAGLKAHIDYKGEDKFSRMMLAMIVEFGECANEWQQFKYWKKNNEPRTKVEVECSCCLGTTDENYEMVQEDAEGNGGHEYIQCSECHGTGIEGYKNSLLEEYVDGLHFILEAGIDLVELGLMNVLPSSIHPIFRPVEPDITKQFKQVVWNAMQLDVDAINKTNSAAAYQRLFGEYVALGYMLGFSEDQIENAYMEKNKENHERQQRNY
ncbi:dUTP diphosphatase [Solibacillus sp. FSL W8-0474]|uniref:dUTP diphosphatase n=1 Tax=Solibacillus sp. FSL W8-0474 TaxID=2975336 RepID=UPI0030F646CC